VFGRVDDRVQFDEQGATISCRISALEPKWHSITERDAQHFPDVFQGGRVVSVLTEGVGRDSQNLLAWSR